jgi:hypothetical protein
MKIKSRAPLGYVREANRVKNNCLDRLADMPGDTLDNSLDRLRSLVFEANALIADMERNRATIEAHRGEANRGTGSHAQDEANRKWNEACARDNKTD